MPSVTKTVELGVPPAEAFELATDPSRFAEWLTLHKAWPNGAPSSAAPGDEFVQQLAIMGMPADVSWKVRSTRCRRASSSPGPVRWAPSSRRGSARSPRAEGTTISYEAEFSGGGIQGPMGEMVTKKAGEELETSLAKLKDLAG